MREEKTAEQYEDFDLLVQFNNGSEKAFTRIVEKHSGPLINFLHRYTQNQAASEDIAQEAFLRLYKATLIYKIACNLAIDQARKTRSRNSRIQIQNLSAEGGRPEEPADRPDTAPDAIYEKNQRNTEIARMLAALPDTQQLAIILKVYENRSYSEIAEIMGLSVSSVESLLFRARQCLGKKLEK
jgi:RNA polymerase sigma-70 factor (ECF subfamily)